MSVFKSHKSTANFNQAQKSHGVLFLKSFITKHGDVFHFVLIFINAVHIIVVQISIILLHYLGVEFINMSL